MKKIIFDGFHVKRFRSLLDVKINFSSDSPIVICGENNIGKTNFLRSLNLYFNHRNGCDFNPSTDIPHHIYEGSRGAGAKTELIGTFRDGANKSVVKIVFTDAATSYFLDNSNAEYEDVSDFFESFNYLFIESHNVNLPNLIAAVLEKDGLLPLDSKRSKQSKPLEALSNFIQLSQLAIKDIEKDINECFKKLTDFDGFLKGKEVKINFAEFEKLRDVVKTMTEITLYDGNDHSIALKGSGAQRALFLSLMEYISENSKKNIIWGVDEPEAFLQPKLQKQVADVFRKTVKEKKIPIIVTTHSQHFIDLSNLAHTYLFKPTLQSRNYQRKPGVTFFEINTTNTPFSSPTEKVLAIKDHLGIEGNDGWEVLPTNILLEGEEDKKYLEVLLRQKGMPTPNIVWSGGASKIGGYLQYYNSFAQDLGFKPKFVCIFDNDLEGREQAKKIKPQSLRNILTKIVPLPRYDGKEHDPLITISSDGNWSIEDFLPSDIFLETVNILLKKEGYRKITAQQMINRNAAANKTKLILQYAEECTSNNNPSKPSLSLMDEGRKKQLCKIFCDYVSKSWGCLEGKFDIQFRFLEKIQQEFST